MDYVFYTLVAVCVVLTAVNCYRIYHKTDGELSLPTKLVRIELEVTRLLFWIMILGIVGNHSSLSVVSNVAALLAAIVSTRILFEGFNQGDRKMFVGAAKIMLGIVVVYVFFYFLDYFHAL